MVPLPFACIPVQCWPPNGAWRMECPAPRDEVIPSVFTLDSASEPEGLAARRGGQPQPIGQGLTTKVEPLTHFVLLQAQAGCSALMQAVARPEAHELRVTSPLCDGDWKPFHCKCGT